MSKTISLQNYTSEASTLIVGSQDLADSNKHKEATPLHFLIISLNSSDALEYWKQVKVDLEELKSQAEVLLSKLSTVENEESNLSSALLRLMTRAESEAGKGSVAIINLLTALSQETEGPAAALLQTFKVPKEVFRGMKVSKLNLPNYLIDLTAQARNKELEPMIGRDSELRRLIQVLGRQHKHHPLLVGEVGVGKRTIVNALASKIVAAQVPDNLSSYLVLRLDLNALLSGVKLRGEVGDRIRKALDVVKGQNVILHLPFLESLFGQSNLLNGLNDALMSLVHRSDLRVIGSTTPGHYQKLVEKEANFFNRFTPLNLEPLTADQTVEVLRGVAPRFEKHHSIKIGDPAITASVRLAKRYLQNRFLPDSAIDLLDESASRKKMEVDGMSPELDAMIHRFSSIKAQLVGLQGDDDTASVKTRKKFENELGSLETEIAKEKDEYKVVEGAEDRILGENTIAGVLGDWTGIPLNKMLESETEKFNKMEERLTQRVVGQDDAVKALAKAIRRSCSGLRDPKKPIGSFLFLGPSGVGKTELSKALAEFLFDDEQAMTRIDLSEYGEKHHAQRLIGSPVGYEGSSDGGFLTEAVRKKPYSVILFDEFEKAHPDVFNLFLQILDDGRLTDGRSRTADFTNTVVIMTSNIGSQKILEEPEEKFATKEGREEIKKVITKELHQVMRPELINRFEDIVVFSALTKNHLRGIVDIQLKKVEKLIADKEITLDLSEEAKQKLVDWGYQPSFGARPLNRAILKNLQDPLSERLMAGKYKNGSIVRVSANEQGLQFTDGS